MTDVLWLGKPIPWKRTLGSGKRRYTNPVYGAWKDDFGWAAKQAHDGEPWDTPTVVRILVAPGGVQARFTPATPGPVVHTVEVVRRPKGIRGDLDNYVKAVLDSVQKIVVKDDRLIVGISAGFVSTIRP